MYNANGPLSPPGGPAPAGCAGYQDIVVDVNRPTKMAAFMKKTGEGIDLFSWGIKNLRRWGSFRRLGTRCRKHNQDSQEKHPVDRS